MLARTSTEGVLLLLSRLGLTRRCCRAHFLHTGSASSRAWDTKNTRPTPGDPWHQDASDEVNEDSVPSSSGAECISESRPPTDDPTPTCVLHGHASEYQFVTDGRTLESQPAADGHPSEPQPAADGRHSEPQPATDGRPSEPQPPADGHPPEPQPVMELEEAAGSGPGHPVGTPPILRTEGVVPGRGPPPEPPVDCCMSGCANCVWIAYAESLKDYYKDGGITARDALDQIENQSLKMFVKLEMGL